VIGAAIVCSMLTAGLMGTIIPILSKRFGFDPATTAGPFETAFQAWLLCSKAGWSDIAEAKKIPASNETGILLLYIMLMH